MALPGLTPSSGSRTLPLPAARPPEPRSRRDSHTEQGSVLDPGALVPVDPREVFLTAILHHAAALIVVHYHPPHRLRRTKAIARRLRLCGGLLDIAVIDFLIVAGGELFVSLRDTGALQVA